MRTRLRRDVHTSRFCSADVSRESDTISAHSHVTSSSVNTSADSQVSESQTNGKSFVEQQIAEEPSVARTKRTRNEEEWNQPGPWEVQACINSTEHPSNITLGRNTRHAKRNVEITLGAMSIPKQSEFVSRQINPVEVKKTAEQLELMEVAESPPE